jgi:hypothetical protein
MQLPKKLFTFTLLLYFLCSAGLAARFTLFAFTPTQQAFAGGWACFFIAFFSGVLFLFFVYFLLLMEWIFSTLLKQAWRQAGVFSLI